MKLKKKINKIKIIDQIEKVRKKNNKNWMDILRIAFKYAPNQASRVLSEIYKEDKNPLNATVFPLAFPLIAGPGSLTTLLSLKAAYSNANIIVAIIINMFFIYIVLKGSSKIEKIIGENGIGIIRKIFGVILLAISIKLFTSNIKFLL